jgi:DNA replication and repair protein RecF
LTLQSLQIDDLRCVQRAELELDPRLTLIAGANGSGKSTLLEAIFLLGRGRSFRTARLETAVRVGSERLRVVGNVTSGPRVLTIGVESDNGSLRARVGGAPVESLAGLALAFPVQVIDPGVHKLIEEGPVGRRRYLDWGVFHVEQGYLLQWQRLQRVLKQRNAALRTDVADELVDAFDRELASVGEEISAARSRYAADLVPYIATSCERLLGEHISVQYSKGWPEGATLEEALALARERDRRRRASTVGPHRADLILERLEGPARITVSRGQQKLMAAAMVLGQLALHAERQELSTTLLLDDPAAELDAERLGRLVDEVRRLPGQVVMTSLTPGVELLGKPGRTFHVEQGAVSPGKL